MSRQSKPKNGKRKASPSMRKATFKDLCDQLNKNLIGIGGVEDAENDIIKFEINEKETPCHLTDEYLDIAFVIYASLKRMPPQFALSNYGYHEGRFKNRIVELFPLMKIVKKPISQQSDA